jgi:hypothetical protein
MTDTIILYCQASGEREFSLTHAQNIMVEQGKWKKLPLDQTWQLSEDSKFEFVDGVLRLKKRKKNADDNGNKGPDSEA